MPDVWTLIAFSVGLIAGAGLSYAPRLLATWRMQRRIEKRLKAIRGKQSASIVPLHRRAK